MASLITALFFAVVAALFVASPADAFTQAQWTAAYNMPELVFQDQWPIQTAVLTTPPAAIWKIFRQFGCSVSLLYPTLQWEIIDGPSAGLSSADPAACTNPPSISEVGVTYNVSFPGITDYLLRVTSVDDYNMQRCFQLNGPGAFPGVYVSQYSSCSKLSPIVYNDKNGVQHQYALYQIWAQYGIAADVPDGVSSIEQKDLFNSLYSGETAQMAVTFGDALANPATCPPPTTCPPNPCTATVTIAPRAGSSWTSNGVTSTIYDFTVKNTGTQTITGVSAKLNLASGASVTQEWNYNPSTGAFSNFYQIPVSGSDTNAGVVVSGGSSAPTVGTVTATCSA